MIALEQKFAPEIMTELAQRVRSRRKERGLNQQQFAARAGMSFGSYKRFEQCGEISLRSLIGIALALGCENEFDDLFAKQGYSSIEEVINDVRWPDRFP